MVRKRDRVYWVLMERTYLFMWKAHSLYKTRKEAEAARNGMGLKDKALKIDRVELVD